MSEAKNRLSALIDHVRQGESVVIEDRCVPVAQLTPVAASTARDKDRLARLVRQGILRPPLAIARKRILDTAPPKPRRPVSLSRLLIEERRRSR